MAIGKIKASRVNNVDANTYIGEDGILFYNYANGVVRISDGITPGGVSVPYTIASGSVIGGIKAGAGANVAPDGTLTIDTSGLPLNIGNLLISDTSISTLQPDVDLNLIANGEGQINLVGNVHIHTTDGGLASDPVVDVNDQGRVAIYVPGAESTSAVQIIGSLTGGVIAPGTMGAMLHITGQLDTPSRFYHDGNNEYVAWVARRWNGNVSTPTQVLANDYVLRINSTAATDAGVGNVAMAQISTQALEDQTTTAQGSQITFTVTPVGQPATNRVDVANVTVANGVTATKFTTSGTVTATGNITGGNIIISNGGLVSSTGLISTTGNITAGNVTATGALTGHYVRTVRNAGVIADGGTLTVNFSTDAIVYCTWANGMTLNYSNFTPGSVVKVMCTKDAGSGTDSLSLEGLTASQISSGSTTVTGTAGTTTFIELTCVNTTIGSVYAKL